MLRVCRRQGLAKRTEEHMKGMVVPGTLFDELGLNYMGPSTATIYRPCGNLNNIKDLQASVFTSSLAKGKATCR